MADPSAQLAPASEVAAPVEEEWRKFPDDIMSLCLSGGGYRAMLFHVGALWRLGETGHLRRAARISSVSGGSITAAVLGMNWAKLAFDSEGRIDRHSFERELVAPVRKLAGVTVDLPAVLSGMAIPGTTIANRVAAAYTRHLFGKKALHDLPAEDQGPHFVINATNLQSGALWRFSRPFARDYKVGEIRNPQFPLSLAVAASSAFPPVLAPLRLRLREDDYTPESGDGLQSREYTTRPVLGDGGIYDNLGLQTISGYRTLLISDGGGAMQADPGGLGPLGWWRWRDWGSQSFRVLHVIDNQVRNLRKREAISAFKAKDHAIHRDGTYWGIRSHVADYGLADPIDFPVKLAEELAAVPTRLKRLDERKQEQLIDWGYAICDTALRTWVDRGLPRPTRLPYESKAAH
jgi:NTE family protein